MKHVFTIFCISLFFYPLHMRSMGKEEQTKAIDLFSLTELPNDILGYIADQVSSRGVYQIFPHVQRIIFYIQLRALCKKFHTSLMLKVIGNVFKHCDQNYKNKMLELAILDYRSQRSLPLALIYAGAEQKNGDLLERVVFYNDVSAAEILFKHKADPLIKMAVDGPFYMKQSSMAGKSILVGVKTREMAQLFIDNGADIHSTEKGEFFS